MTPGWLREWFRSPRELRDAQQVVHEDPDRLGYSLTPPNPLLQVASEEVWREIERNALS